MKRTYKILIISAIVLLVILGIYLGWKKILAPEITPAPEIGGAPLPTAPLSDGGRVEGGTAEKSAAGLILKKLSEEKVFGFGVVQASGEVFYLTPGGKIMSAKDGPDLEISKESVTALNSIELNPKDQKFLVSFGDPRRPQWGIFDLIDKVWRPLPIDIVNATWGLDDDKLVASIKKTNEYNLSEVDLTKSPPSYKLISRDFRMKDVKLAYLNPQKLVVGERSSAFYEGRVWQLDLKTNLFNLIVPAERGLTLGWSKDKNSAFKFSASGFYVLGANLAPIFKTDFITLPEKCDAVSEISFCFVPQNLTIRNVFPDNYFTKEFFSVDRLVQFDTFSGVSEDLLKSGEGGIAAIDAKNPEVLGDRVYFINRYDDYLYELSGLPELKINESLPL